MKTFFTIVLLTIATASFSQTTISGRITDAKGEAISGANILIENSYDGISSALDGTFNFTTTEQGIKPLVVSFIGYQTTIQLVDLKGESINLIIKLKEEINQLEAVVISAGSFTAGEEKKRTVLKALDIATTAGATADIAGALNTLPGTQKVGESGRLFVRGGDGNETRTFIDGMVVLDAYGTSAPNTPSRGRFLPFMFKGTSFSTGGYSAEYGQALSSALVLNSRDKADMNQTDIGLLSVGADVAHTQDWLRACLSGIIQYTNIRPYIGLINQRIDWKDAPVSLEGSTAYRMQVGKKGLFKFFGNFTRSNFSMYNHDILNPQSKQLYELSNKYSYGNASYADVINDKWSVHGGLSYTLNQNNTTINAQTLDETEKGIHGKLVFDHSLSDLIELKFGGEVISRDYTFFHKADQTVNLGFKENIYASFIETEIYVSSRFVARGGARIEYNNLNETLSVDPRVSIAFKPASQGQFAFAYGVFRQSAKNQYVRINQSLNDEKAEHFILNYQIINDKRTFRTELYYKKYNDLVKFENGNQYTLNNAGNGYAKGLEFFLRDSKTLKNVDYWLSYSFLDTKRNYLNFPNAVAPSFASKHNFSFVYKHFITKLKSQLGLTYSYSSGRPYQDPNETRFNSRSTPSYQDVSANISYLPKSFLIIHVSFTNILGRDNIFGYQYSAMPNENGVFESVAIRQAAKRFLFVGVFITLSKNKSVNQLPNF